METHDIIISGAKENNLKNISLVIPKGKITAFTGVSGSGKSSLVFDIVATESQRLLSETYSSYIRHRMMAKYTKPEVDKIENLAVAIVIDQKRIEGNSRSTVGTITDIYALLRLLYSRVGEPFVGYSNIFSFNNPQGMCPRCEGLGKVNTIDLTRIINKDKSLNEGAIEFPTFEPGKWRWIRYAYTGLFDRDKKLGEYSEEEWHNLLYAEKVKLKNPDPKFPKTAVYEGLLPRFERSFFKNEGRLKTGKVAERFNEIAVEGECPLCHGKRLSQEVLKCKIQGKDIADCCSLQIDDLLDFLKSIKINPVIKPILEELMPMLENLILIGLSYLTLNRITPTLSGGESQRIKLVRHLGSSLTDLIYIFDEPSIGLHPSDVHKLNKLLIELKEKGNTVLVVEHDPDVIALAEHIVDMGPNAGRNGGEVVYKGSLKGLLKSGTRTGNYLSEPKSIKTQYRKPKGYMDLSHVNLHNLKDVSTRIPEEVVTVITGVAGSGKSSLIKAFLSRNPEVIMIDQSVLRGSRRSTPATYTGIMDTIREMFSKQNKVKASLFSNFSEGACPECKGNGIISTDLAFMDSVEVICDSCNGSGFKNEVLHYLLNGKNIVEVLGLSVEEALGFFTEPAITSALERLYEVGLEYLTLGQSLNTLSGGERQRLKLANELGNKGNCYVFDEPTTGLHGSDIAKLMKLFDRLSDNKNTLIIIEHNLDVIAKADWLIDVGPGAGRDGGKIIFEGYPKDIIKLSDNKTGYYLKHYVNI
ncbi:excinuclease ABC subunit UvrA [Apibacter raozihei]|uniref:ATP-binding cassette domain-containing protein n=1 Tax=Apibacter raozihei TaxID=2500547 RepID=UPI000FE3DD6B|nr:excinuclease ABC subunit UvrA [Apibacter raozihei]